MIQKLYPKVINALRILASQLYRVPILIYHSIGGSDKDAIPLGLFKRQIKFFRENGYSVIPLYSLIELIAGNKKAASPAISITFDDGFMDTFSLAYPILKEYGFAATVFVTVNKIGQKGYLNYSQIRQMVDEKLITVGSHTATHVDLMRLDDAGLLYEIEGSKKALEDGLNCRVELFAYPWGAYSLYIKEAVVRAGYKAAFSTNSKPSNNFQAKDLYALRRISMVPQDSFLRFLVKVSGFGNCFARTINYQRR